MSTETFSITPNWTDKLRERLKDLRKSETLGRCSAQTISGYVDSLRFSQDIDFLLDRDEARELMAFFRARRGSWQAFKFALPWSPGDADNNAPHAFDDAATVGLVRFASDKLILKWMAPNLVQATIGFVQDRDSVESDARVNLYHFYAEDSESGRPDEYLTEWPAAVVYNGQTWQPARIQHEEITESVEVQKETCKLAVDVRDSALIRAKVRRELDGHVMAEIVQLDFATGTAADLFSGRVSKTPRCGLVIKPEVQLWGSVIAQQLPTVLKSRDCPHRLYSAGCRSCNAARMAKENWVSTGTYISTWSNGVVALKADAIDAKATAYFAAYPNAAQANDKVVNWSYWAGGIAITGAGISRQVRSLKMSAIGVDGVITLIPGKPFRTGAGWLTAGDTVRLYPGCDLQYSTCVNKFANAAAYGGQQNTPAYIEEAAAQSSTSGK